jgi:hypothetical protein
MVPPAPTSNPRQREPLFEIDPRTGVSFEVFYSDRTLETFGKCGAGWFWHCRRRGCSPDGPAIGPFATRYSAYRYAMTSQQGCLVSQHCPARAITPDDCS